MGELEGAAAQTVLVVAPAGYGKTTFARQWLDRAGGSYLTVTPASRDIPVLARDLAVALSDITSLDLRRVETALGAAHTPGDQARAVARTILAQVQAPVETWLVIDDYQLLMQGRAAESFIAALEASGRFRLMIVSRERPSWATARRFFHLELLELGSPDLALDPEEIAELLPPSRHTAAFVEQARGWPAVIALAAHLRSEDAPVTSSLLSESLYEYFAEEVFAHTSSHGRRLMTRIALLPPLSQSELLQHLGETLSLNEVVSSGLVHLTDGIVDVHPLARAFLFTKLIDDADRDKWSRSSAVFCLSKNLWDETFELIQAFRLTDLMERLITDAFPHLVKTGRVNTLRRFAEHAALVGGTPEYLLDLVHAELALRDGALDRALTLAARAADRMPHTHALRTRCYIVAGKASHLAHRLDDALSLYTAAVQLAVEPADVSEAIWGRCSAALFLEDASAPDAVAKLESIAEPRPEDRIRLLSARHHQAYLGGGVGPIPISDDLEPHVLDAVSDPWIRTAWWSTVGYTLILGAHYEEARKAFTTTLEELDGFGLSFGMSQIHWSLAACELGLRHFSRCELWLRKVEQSHADRADQHAHLNVRALRARLYLAQGRVGDAVELTSEDFTEVPTKAMYGEYLGTRALALAVAGDFSQAADSARLAIALTSGIDTQILCRAADMIIAIGRCEAVEEAGGALLDFAAGSGCWDGVVCAVRAASTLMPHLCAVTRHKVELQSVCLRSNDMTLARMAGVIGFARGEKDVLSRRETDIIEAISAGMLDREIAMMLYIELATIKTHVRSIKDKLKARTRAEAVAIYAEMTAARGGSS